MRVSPRLCITNHVIDTMFNWRVFGTISELSVVARCRAGVYRDDMMVKG